MNVAEILADRGELAEAEALLLDTLPVWRSSRYRYLLGGCLWYLGRIALRGRRLDEAVARLEEARALFVQVKREEEVLDVDARLALCRVFKGELDEALAAATEGLVKARGSKIAKVIPVLERVRGYAMLRRGDSRAPTEPWRRAWSPHERAATCRKSRSRCTRCSKCAIAQASIRCRSGWPRAKR